jgi:mRNA interferase MazF
VKQWNGLTRLPETWKMKRGQVWRVELDPSVGSEIRKTRPAVIVSNDSANRNLLRVFVIPLSTNTSRFYPGESLVTLEGKQGKAMTDPIMAADKIRLKTQIGTLSKTDMLGVEQAILVHLGLPK